MMDQLGYCELCDKVTDKKCTGCLTTFYCSESHQKEKWLTHKEVCHPFQIIDDRFAFKGGHWVATRDLIPGEVLLDEVPIVFGPMYSDYDSRPTCVSCCEIINAKDLRPCRRCGIPVCGPECEKNPVHAHNECIQIARNINTPLFDSHHRCLYPFELSMCIMMIRGAEMKSLNSVSYRQLLELRNTCQNNDNFNSVSNETAKSVLEWLKYLLLSRPLEFPDDVYTRILQVFRLNGFSHNDKEISFDTGIPITNSNSNIIDQRVRHYRSYAVYSKTSKLKYSCVPNCSWTICPERDFKIRIRVCVPVKKGEELTISCDALTGSFEGTLNRQRTLKTIYGIGCACLRCMDPTELGLYSSSVICTSHYCREKLEKGQKFGYYLPDNPLEDNPEAIWKCSLCKDVKTQKTLLGIVCFIGESLAKTVMTEKEPLRHIKLFTQALGTCSKKVLHGNHGLLAEAISSVVKTFDLLGILTLEAMNDRIFLLKYILAIRDRMCPGLSSVRASVMKQLVFAITSKLETFGHSFCIEDLATDYVLLMECSKEGFEYYMNDFSRPGEDFNYFGKLLFSSMKSAQIEWEYKILTGARKNIVKLKLFLLQPFLELLCTVNSAIDLGKRLKEVKV